MMFARFFAFKALDMLRPIALLATHGAGPISADKLPLRD